MYSEPASKMPRRHANGWMTLMALGLLGVAFLACLYVLVGFPAGAQTLSDAASHLASQAATNQSGTNQVAATQIAPTEVATTQAGTPQDGTTQTAPAGSSSANSAAAPVTPNQYPQQYAPQQRRLRPRMQSYAYPVIVSPAPPPVAQVPEAVTNALRTEIDSMHAQLNQSQDNLRQAAQSERRTRIASALFLVIFAIIAGLIVVQVYVQARGLDSESSKTVEEVKALAAQIEARSNRTDSLTALPRLLQQVGEQALIYQEEGVPFTPESAAIIEEIDNLAYVGQGRLAFRDLTSEADAAVYLNGLLLSAVAHLSRRDSWTAFSRLESFFSQLSQFPNAVERSRVAQAYSYRALAAYQVLEGQDDVPSWLRKTDRGQLETLSRQAFADIAQAMTLDPEWKHSTYVEALLCSRFYLPEEATDNNSRRDLYVRGLRRAVSLYKGLVDERAYRGPSRRNMVKALKRIAEETGDKSDFSDFGFALNALPSDEELADEALAARQPNSQDRFLWQWLMGDSDLFAKVERLNLAEYRAFWVRMLDNKVHLRNWRVDLDELKRSNPAMKDWMIQLVQAQEALPMANSLSRRHDRLERPAAGA
jgi:hypothetical protein